MKMKKLICTVLTAALLISTLSMGFGVSGAETGSLLSEGREGLLRYLNITLNGDVIAYDKQITRGEMAHILARVANLPAFTGEGSYFYDVPLTYLYAKDILALVDEGILHGDGDGNYRPNDPISDAEINKVFVSILGYKNLENMETYQKVAQISGITEGTNGDGIVTYAEALRMAHNTLHSGMFDEIIYGDDPVGKVREDFLALERYHGLVCKEGIMDGVSGSTLTHAEDAITAGQISVDGKLYLYNDESLLGHAVIYYVKKDTIEDARPEISYMYSDEMKTTTFTIDAKDIVGRNGSDEFVYMEKNKERKVKLVGAPDVIYNGVAHPKCTDSELKPGTGSVTLIDYDGDRVYDVITISAYEYIVVESVNPDKQMIYGKYPEKIIGSEEQNCILQLKYGAANAYLGVIEGGDVVAIQTSQNTIGTRKIKVDILAAGTVGTVESMNGKHITIGGKVYERNSGTVIDVEPKLGETVTVYTHRDNCAAIIHAENDTYQWGYLTDITDRGTVFTSKISVRVANRDRTMSEYDLAKKITLDGNRIATTDFDAIATMLEAGANESYRNGAEGLRYAQMIRFKLDNSGVITEIDTAHVTPGVEDPEKTLQREYCSYRTDADGDALQYMSSNMVYVNLTHPAGERAQFLLASPNAFWRIPQDARDDVKVWPVNQNPGSDLFYYGPAQSYGRGVLEAYTVDPDNGVAKMAILYEPNSTGVQAFDDKNSRPGIVTEIAKVLDKDGFPVTQISLAGKDVGLTTAILPSDVEGAQTIAIGDVVDVAISNGEVADLDFIYTVKDGWVWSQASFDKDNDNLSGYRANARVAYGMAVSVKDDYLRHTRTLDLANTAEDNYQDFYTLKMAGASFYMYDSEDPSKGIQTVSSGELNPYKRDKNTKQKTIICTSNGKLNYVYIIQ